MKVAFYKPISAAFIFLVLIAHAAMGQGTLSGQVVGPDNEPLTGATLVMKGTTNGTITDVSGNYTLELPAGNQTILASFVGYRTKTQTVSVENGGTVTLNFTLEEDVMTLDAAIVTGTFTARTQMEAPTSMTVISNKQLAQKSFNSQADILRTVPGITAEGGGGEVASNVFVRGMPSAGQYQFTPLQVDGMPTISAFGLNSSAHDVYFRNDIGIRNLEFVRGGAATLFGAGSVAGIINYTSITGGETQENRVGMEYAQGGRIKADFLTAGPLAKDLYYAFSGFYRYDEGPLETGLVSRGYQLRGNIKKRFNEGRSTFTIYGQTINDNAQFYLPFPLINDGGDYKRPTGNDGKEIFTLLSGQATDFAFDTPNGRFESNIENGVVTKGGFVMADLKHAFGDDWLLSTKFKAANYAHEFNLFLDGDGVRNVPETQANYLTERGLPANATFTYVDTGEPLAADDLLFQNRILDRDRPMEEIAAEINLTKTVRVGALEHNFTMGTFLSNTRAEDNNWIAQYLGDFRNNPRLVNLNVVDGAGDSLTFADNGFISGSQTTNQYHQSAKTAVYFADEIYGERFGIDIGVRWERASGTVSRETGVGTNTFNRGEVSASDFAFVLAGLYKLKPNLNIYANVSRGYFFPALRALSFSSPGVPQSYETEKIYQAEAGVKANTGRLAATAAAFITTLNDRRNVEFVNDGQGGLFEEIDLQSTRTIGIEATANYLIIDGLSVDGLLTLQDHEFSEAQANPEIEGNWLRRQPKVKGTLGLNYDKNNIDFNLSATYLGKRYSNDANTAELDPYTIARLTAGYTFALGEGPETVRFGISVFNLFDSEGITEGSPRQGNTQVGGEEFFVGRPVLPRRIAFRALFNF